MEENRKADHPDRRLKLMENLRRQNQQPPQQPPQICPRCDSSNTKFCYFNNYSLSQPRYFCKACRRYWTQGGTLRNVPVGGGCRKGKRAKTCGNSGSSGINGTRPLPSLPLPNSSSPLGAIAGRKEMGTVNISPLNPYYQNGGFFPSFAAMRPLGNPPTLMNHHQQQQQQQHSFGGQFGLGGSSSSNPNIILQGFNNSFPQQQHDQQIFNQSINGQLP